MSTSPFVLKEAWLGFWLLEATQNAAFLYLLFKYVIKQAIKKIDCHNLWVYILVDYSDVQSISDKHAILTFTKCNKVQATAI